MSDNKEKTNACFFCESYTPNKEEPNKGFCHRYAPHPIYGIDISNNKVYWPEVTVWDWCMDFSRRNRHDSKYFEGLVND